MKCTGLLFLLILFIIPAQAQYTQPFTRYDSLRGSLTPLRTCYDVVFYDLNLRVEPKERTIKGYNTIYYKTTADFNRLQVDLFRNMQISRILHHSQELRFERDSNAVFVNFPQIQKKGIIDSISIY